MIAILIALAMETIAAIVPLDLPAGRAIATAGGYREVLRDPTFRRYLPLGFLNYGGLVAVQALWAGPWLTQVCGLPAAQAALGLFSINLTMLVTYMLWGVLSPHLYRRGLSTDQLMARGLPLSLLLLVSALLLGSRATAWVWAAFCASTTFVSLTQLSIGQAVGAELVGRAISAFNLVIFFGVFAVQWGIGLLIDLLQGLGGVSCRPFRVHSPPLPSAAPRRTCGFCGFGMNLPQPRATTLRANAHNSLRCLAF